MYTYFSNINVLIILNRLERIMCQSLNPSTLTLIGVVLIKFATGSIITWGSINLYIISYFKYEGFSVSRSTNSIAILLNIIPMAFLILFATKLSEKFGYQKVIRVCGLLFFLSPMIMHIKLSVFTMTVFCTFIPISAFAISSIPVINCLWTQFPHSKNKATSVAVISFALGGALWSYLFTHYVNPMNQQTIYDQTLQMMFFSREVSYRVVKCLKVGFFICGSLFIVGSFLIRKNTSYADQRSSKNTQQNLQEDTHLKVSDIGQDFQFMETVVGDSQKVQVLKTQYQLLQKIPKTQKTLKQALLDKRFIIIFMISFISGIYQIFLNLNLKIIYMPILHDDQFIVYCSIACMISSILGAFVWGYMADSRGFYLTLLILTFLDLIAKIYGGFAVTKPTVLIFFIAIGFVDKAMLTIMGPGLVKIFGIKLGTELLAYKGLSVFLGYIVAPLGYIILNSVVHPFQYLLILTFLSVVGPILSVWLFKSYSKVKDQNTIEMKNVQKV